MISHIPFALVGRHPHDYCGSSVAVGLVPRRPSRLPSAIDVRSRRRCPVRPLQWTHCPPSTRRRVHGSAVLTRYPDGPASGALRGCVLASLETGVQAIRPSPYRAGLASPGPTHLPTALAFPPCSCPPWLSPQGRVGDPEAVLLRTPPRCARDR